MDGKVFIGCYWKDRPEGRLSGAARLKAMLADLASIDPLLSGWRPLANSLRDALAGPAYDPADLADALARGAVGRGLDAEIASSLGYRWSAWNGNADTSIGLSAHCGAHGPNTSNAVVVNLPSPDDPRAARLYEPEVASRVLRSLVTRWSPADAVATTSDASRTLGGVSPETMIGWMRFVRAAPSALQNLTEADVESVGEGSLLVVPGAWADIQLADLAALQAELRRRGVLPQA